MVLILLWMFPYISFFKEKFVADLKVLMESYDFSLLKEVFDAFYVLFSIVFFPYKVFLS